MLVYEAAILATILDRIRPSSILDIGSGSRADREIIQPHISAVFRGHPTYWADYKESHDVMRCDITDKDSLKYLPRCPVVTAFSVLEHVTDIDEAINNLMSLVYGRLIVSVPYSYPEHNCPIDNMWRPSPDELADRIENSGLIVEEKYETTPEYFQGVTNASASIVVARVANAA